MQSTTLSTTSNNPATTFIFNAAVFVGTVCNFVVDQGHDAYQRTNAAATNVSDSLKVHNLSPTVHQATVIAVTTLVAIATVVNFLWSVGKQYAEIKGYKTPEFTLSLTLPESINRETLTAWLLSQAWFQRIAKVRLPGQQVSVAGQLQGVKFIGKGQPYDQ